MGSIVETPCPTCHGSGRERRTKRFTVKIPAGVEGRYEDQAEGKGEAGYGGAPAGDLFIVTRVEPSKIYERRGDDLIVTVPVSYPTAALGGKVEVPTPEGAVSLKVPSGTEDGKLLRIKGRGAPRLRGGGQGDVLARVRIEVPKRVNKEAARVARRAAEGERLMDTHPRYMISVAADLVGMHPQTLRIYEQKGLVRPQRTRATRGCTPTPTWSGCG